MFKPLYGLLLRFTQPWLQALYICSPFRVLSHFLFQNIRNKNKYSHFFFPNKRRQLRVCFWKKHIHQLLISYCPIKEKWGRAEWLIILILKLWFGREQLLNQEPQWTVYQLIYSFEAVNSWHIEEITYALHSVFCFFVGVLWKKKQHKKLLVFAHMFFHKQSRC